MNLYSSYRKTNILYSSKPTIRSEIELKRKEEQKRKAKKNRVLNKKIRRLNSFHFVELELVVYTEMTYGEKTKLFTTV